MFPLSSTGRGTGRALMRSDLKRAKYLSLSENSNLTPLHVGVTGEVACTASAAAAHRMKRADIFILKFYRRRHLDDFII